MIVAHRPDLGGVFITSPFDKGISLTERAIDRLCLGRPIDWPRVVGIADGDTLTVLTAQRQQHRVRLSGIDAPERRQAFGQVSKQHLSDLAYDKMVSVVFHKRDRYKRILGKVLVNGADAGLNQIQSGLAWHYKKYEREQSPEDRVAYARAEEKSRAKRRGLWRDPRPVATVGVPQVLKWAAGSPSRPRGSTGPRGPLAPRSQEVRPLYNISVIEHPGRQRLWACRRP